MEDINNYVRRIGELPKPDGTLGNSKQTRIYDTNGKAVTICGNGGGMGAKTGIYALQVGEPMMVHEAVASGFAVIPEGGCVDLLHPTSPTRRGRKMEYKSNCLTGENELYQHMGQIGYATPVEWDEDGTPIKAKSNADGKTYPVYVVKDNQITIKSRTYPIKLQDGKWILRKLTVRECARLQTVPEWYHFPVAETRAYRLLGNGWTVEVIAHIIRCCLRGETDGKQEQLSLF